MFPISPDRRIPRNPAAITNGFEVLHFDEVPILVTGRNRYGARVVGSFVEDDERTERYLYVLITPTDYRVFRRQDLSYLELLERAEEIFVVDAGWNSETETVYSIDFSAIPDGYRPSAESMCPVEVGAVGHVQYTAALRGGLADAHLAEPKVAGNLQVLWSRVIETPYCMFKELSGVHALLQPSTAGSYRLNYDIYVDVEPTLFGFDEYHRFAEHFVSYCLSDLSADAERLISDDEDPPAGFRSLLRRFEKVKQERGSGGREDSHHTLVQVLASAADYLDQIGTAIDSSFHWIDLSYNDGFEEITMGSLDRKFATAIESVVETLEAWKNPVVVDTEPQRYDVIIYDLNTETRKGHARIQSRNNPSTWWKPKITISGDTGLSGSLFTDSMHSERLISVMALARHVGDRISSMLIVGGAIEK